MVWDFPLASQSTFNLEEGGQAGSPFELHRFREDYSPSVAAARTAELTALSHLRIDDGRAALNIINDIFKTVFLKEMKETVQNKLLMKDSEIRIAEGMLKWGVNPRSLRLSVWSGIVRTPRLEAWIRRVGSSGGIGRPIYILHKKPCRPIQIWREYNWFRWFLNFTIPMIMNLWQTREVQF